MNKEMLPSENPPNALRSEHLGKGVFPIISCVGTFDTFGEDLKSVKILGEMYGAEGDGSTQFVNFFDNKEVMDEKGYKNQGRQTYVISSLNPLNKFTRGIMNCVGLVVAGKEKGTEKEISFMDHGCWEYFLKNDENKKSFLPILTHLFGKLRKSARKEPLMRFCSEEIILPKAEKPNSSETAIPVQSNFCRNRWQTNFILIRSSLSDRNSFGEEKQKTCFTIPKSVGCISFANKIWRMIFPEVICRAIWKARNRNGETKKNKKILHYLFIALLYFQ